MDIDRLEFYRRRYADIVPGWESATARYQRWVAASLREGTRVLDLGCGRGGIVERLHHRGNWIGTDPDFRSLTEHRWLALPRVLSRATHLPFADAGFNVVASSWVLEHLPDPHATFADVARVLRPGGWFFFLTPNARHPIPRLSRLLMRLQRFQRQIVPWVYGRPAADTFPVYYRANTPEQLTHLALSAGLHPTRIELVDDPSYFAWNGLSFRGATFLERCLPPLWKVHLIGAFQKPPVFNPKGGQNVTP